MTPLQKRISLFLFGCIPTRLALVALAAYSPIAYLPLVGLIGLIISIGFLYLYFTGKRTTGPETMGAPIWWMPFRIIHGLLYLLFALLAFNKVKKAYVVILIDTLIGLLLFLNHHIREPRFP
jgi:hypothetical protein